MSTEPKETTSDTSAGIACPHCGETIADLWDYTWGDSELMDIECSHCDNAITLRKVVSATYYAKAVTS